MPDVSRVHCLQACTCIHSSFPSVSTTCRSTRNVYQSGHGTWSCHARQSCGVHLFPLCCPPVYINGCLDGLKPVSKQLAIFCSHFINQNQSRDSRTPHSSQEVLFSKCPVQRELRKTLANKTDAHSMSQSCLTLRIWYFIILVVCKLIILTLCSLLDTMKSGSFNGKFQNCAWVPFIMNW